MTIDHSFKRKEFGLTYVWVLVFVAVAGIAAARLGDSWSVTNQREREAELLFVGRQIRTAIGAYYESTPGSIKQYPQRLEQLLKDERFPQVRRHLRRIYLDPFSGSADWLFITLSDGGIVGVHSRSRLRPLKRSGFDPTDALFQDAAKLSDWMFVHSSPIGLRERGG